MENKETIGYLDTYSKEAGGKVKSSTRLMQVLWLAVTAILLGWYFYKMYNNIDWWGLTFFTFINLIGIFIPSKLDKLIDAIKERIKK